MKIGLYSPFLAENIGGGERYILTVADCLLSQHQVDLIIQQQFNYTSKQLQALKQHFIKTFNLKLDKLNLISGPFGPQTSSKARQTFTKAYDIFYYMTDGSFFVSKAKHNAVHFMIPFNQPPKSILQKLKLKAWPIKVANSFFTKKHLERVWKIKVNHVHWGAVNSQDFQPLPKQNIILNVGRFFSPKGNKHCKRQDFLVKTFKKMVDQGLKGWQLILNGPIDKGKDNLAYAKKVAQLAKGYPIAIRHQSQFNLLQKDYGQAKIYWHATGYGIDEIKNPQAVEHLGLSTVEAMSAGAVPVVIKKGGQLEVVTHDLNGLLWQTQAELIDQTLAVINQPQLFNQLSKAARTRAKAFSKPKFCQMTKKIFNL